MTTNQGQPAAVTVIGLGDMGHALAQSLLNHDYRVAVWNRSPGKSDALVSRGAELITDIQAALGANPVTIICVTNHQATMELLESAQQLPGPGEMTLVQLSTMTSAESVELAEWTKQAGVNYLDGQILSYPEDVLEGRADIVCSGEKRLFNNLQSLLENTAGTVHHVGEQIGSAPAFDKAHIAWAMGNYLAFLQAAAMCRKSGVDLRAWCDFNLKNIESGAAARELSVLSEQICSREYEEGLDVTMDVWLNAIAKTIEEFDSVGMNDTHLARLHQLSSRAVESGLSEKELGILFEQMISETER